MNSTLFVPHPAVMFRNDRRLLSGKALGIAGMNTAGQDEIKRKRRCNSQTFRLSIALNKKKYESTAEARFRLLKTFSSCWRLIRRTGSNVRIWRVNKSQFRRGWNTRWSRGTPGVRLVRFYEFTYAMIFFISFIGSFFQWQQESSCLRSSTETIILIAWTVSVQIKRGWYYHKLRRLYYYSS